MILACNTASALALPTIRARFPGLPISGVVEPGAKAAVVAAGSKQVPIIGVLGTEATIRSKAYDRAIHRRRNHARLLLRPTPLLVHFIEEGRDERDPVTRLALKQYLQPLVDHRVDVVLLGCTHYPVYKALIRRMMGPRVTVIDSAEQCADDVARRLREAGLARASGPMIGGRPLRPALRCFVTDDPALPATGASLSWRGDRRADVGVARRAVRAQVGAGRRAGRSRVAGLPRPPNRPMLGAEACDVW